jgi:hypothetical protein
VFECFAKSCKGKGKYPRRVNRFLDKADAKSTGNLRKHAKVCWGDDTVRAGDDTKDIVAAREAVKKNKLKDGTLTAVFHRLGKGKVPYSHRQHMKAETR